MNRMMRFTIILVISAVIIGLSACEQLIQLLSDGDTSEMHSVPPQLLGVDGEIPIGLVYPETGRLSEFGLPIKRGFELALEEINSAQQGDARIKFIVEDDRSTIEGAVEAYRRLIEKDKVPIIFGPTTSGSSRSGFSNR